MTSHSTYSWCPKCPPPSRDSNTLPQTWTPVVSESLISWWTYLLFNQSCVEVIKVLNVDVCAMHALLHYAPRGSLLDSNQECWAAITKFCNKHKLIQSSECTASTRLLLAETYCCFYSNIADLIVFVEMWYIGSMVCFARCSNYSNAKFHPHRCNVSSLCGKNPIDLWITKTFCSPK